MSHMLDAINISSLFYVKWNTSLVQLFSHKCVDKLPFWTLQFNIVVGAICYKKSTQAILLFFTCTPNPCTASKDH